MKVRQIIGTLALAALFMSCKPSESSKSEETEVTPVDFGAESVGEPVEPGKEAKKKDPKDLEEFKGEAKRMRDEQKEGLENLLPYGRKREE